MDLETYKKQFTEDDAVGWDCIDEKLADIYGEQEPGHYAAELPYELGGEDPLNGVSFYTSAKQQPHFHFVTYGFSELYYDENSAGSEYSKFGFELTFRLKLESEEDDEIGWVYNMLQNIARYVFQTGKWFEPFHFLPAGAPIKMDSDSEITALAFVSDPELGKIDTPHGEVAFLQIVGLTTAEFQELKKNPTTTEVEKLIDKLQQNNKLLITDLERK
ncbi:suppressor of fused domain protein [Sinomicrobium sp.]